jgi:PAS domain S-box-containing protein
MTSGWLAALESAVGDLQVPAVVADESMTLIAVSAGAVEATGYDRATLVGRSAATLAADPTEFAVVAETIAAGETWSGTFTVRCADARRIRGRGSTAPVTVDGELVGFLGTFTDTTRRRRYENATKVLGRLMRHDLRHDLNRLLGHLDAATRAVTAEAGVEGDRDVDTAGDVDASAHLERAVATVEETVSTIDRAGDLRSLLERSAEEPFRVIRLDEVLATELTRFRDRYPGARLQTPEATDPVFVLADDLLGTVIEAVLENAVEHNPRADPLVDVSVTLADRTATLTVADDGPGIPPEQRDVALGRNERDQLNHGTGLDLFVVDNVIEEYGGSVSIRDREPRGAAFDLQFVRVPDADLDDDPTAPTGVDGDASPGRPADPAGDADSA